MGADPDLRIGRRNGQFADAGNDGLVADALAPGIEEMEMLAVALAGKTGLTVGDISQSLRTSLGFAISKINIEEGGGFHALRLPCGTSGKRWEDARNLIGAA